MSSCPDPQPRLLNTCLGPRPGYGVPRGRSDAGRPQGGPAAALGRGRDEEDLALLGPRDLLFARLLQYRAYKQAAAMFAARMAGESQRFPRAVGLEEPFAGLLPEVLLGLGPNEFAAMAQRVLTPRAAPVLPWTTWMRPGSACASRQRCL